MQTDTITIQGHAFEVPVRYSEGHVLTAGEAQALNQTFHENLRNNFAKLVKDANEKAGIEIAKGDDVQQDLPEDVKAELQSKLDENAEAYQFGVRAPGSRVSADPVRRQAESLARGAIRAKLKEQGKTATKEQIEEAVEAILADPVRGERFMDAARKAIEEAKARQASLADLAA